MGRSLGSAVVGRCGEGARAEKDDMCDVCDACDAAEADRNDASCCREISTDNRQVDSKLFYKIHKIRALRKERGTGKC